MGKKYIVMTLVFLVLCTGGGAVLQWNTQEDADQVWEPELLLLSSEELKKEYNLARWYNLNLREQNPEKDYDSVYVQLLDFGAGKMGYLEIPSLGLWHSIVHEGEYQAEMDYAVHCFGTALPVGGKGNCPVLRCGGVEKTPAAGDIFCIHILDAVITYQVTEVDEKLPKNPNGEDRCVLDFSSESGTVYVTGVRIEGIGICS